MSQEHVETLDRLMEALNRRDIDGFLALVDAEVDFIPYTVAMQGTYHGHDGLRQWWLDLFGVFPDWRADVVEVRDLGELTLATLHVRGRGGGSGTPVDQTLWQLGEWSAEGKLLRASNHASEAGALEAVGLSE